MLRSSVSRKRSRGSQSLSQLSGMCADDIRRALASRAAADAIPPRWKACARDAGTRSVHDFLCSIGSSVTSALRVVAESGVSARFSLQDARSRLHAAVDIRCDDIESQLLTAESTKVAALERQLVAVDDALERWRTESSDLIHIAEGLSDTGLAAQQAALAARLDALEVQLSTLSIIPVEVPFIGLAVDTPDLLSRISRFGRVIAPRAITASHLSLLDPPRWVRSGATLQLRLILGDSHIAQSTEELEMALGFAAAAMRGTAELETSQHNPISISFAGNITARAIYVNVAIPQSTPAGARVCVNGLTLGGRSLTGFETPLRIPVYVGVSAPLTLKPDGDCEGTPCITPDGVICVPSQGSKPMLFFNQDGVPLLGMTAEFSLSGNTCGLAYYYAEKPLLLFADDSRASSRLVAVDPVSRAVRWATAPGAMNGCSGIDVLSPQGVCIVYSYNDEKLYAHRLSDGMRVGSIVLPAVDAFLAAVPTTGTLFSSALPYDGSSGKVNSWMWTPESTFQDTGIVEAAGASASGPLAVVPPAPGKLHWYLLSASCYKERLRVIALPTLTLVHTHVLEGMELCGLAADPSGTAIAVCDRASQAVHVLAWPLPGMPPLE